MVTTIVFFTECCVFEKYGSLVRKPRTEYFLLKNQVKRHNLYCKNKLSCQISKKNPSSGNDKAKLRFPTVSCSENRKENISPRQCSNEYSNIRR